MLPKCLLKLRPFLAKIFPSDKGQRLFLRGIPSSPLATIILLFDNNGNQHLRKNQDNETDL